MSLPVPYILDFSHLAIDDVISFCVAVLIAITINAEGQAFMAILLGDARPDSEKRLHFNPLLHLNVCGVICFLVAGFGWPKEVDVNVSKFSRPRLFVVLSRFAGPVANFLLASIAGSIIWLMGKFGFEDRVFTIVLAVNLTVAVYHILPIPPLAGSSIIPALFSHQDKRFQRFYHQAGSFLLVGVFLTERISNWKILSGFLDPVVRALFTFFKG